MIAVIQSVENASVSVGGSPVSSIEKGMLVYFGVEKGDDESVLDKFLEKMMKLRIFKDENGKMNLSLSQAGGDVMMISQFTLAGDIYKGNRPGFDNAAAPADARRIYEKAVSMLRDMGYTVATGMFGEHMKVVYCNSQIDKQFGKGSLMKLGDAQGTLDVEVIPSGSLLLDEALGVGGYPKGRIIEIYGPESSGKTTLALHAIAESQKLGGIAAFIDAEHALDPTYAKNLGVNINELWISQPDNGEQALEITESLVRSGAVDIIVVDSVAALTPQAEIDGDMGDSHMGVQARLMSQALRKLTGILAKSNTTIIFINQLRMKIGVMFGNPETTTGGNALKFYASIRMDVRKVESIGKSQDDLVGNRVRVKIVKNKVAPPFKKCELDLLFGKGISYVGSMLDAALKYNMIEKSGSWYSYNGEKVGQGRDKTIEYFENNPDLVNEIVASLREKMFPKKADENGSQEKGRE